MQMTLEEKKMLHDRKKMPHNRQKMLYYRKKICLMGGRVRVTNYRRQWNGMGFQVIPSTFSHPHIHVIMQRGTVYELDNWECFYPAEVVDPGKKKGYPGTSTYELDLPSLLSVSYILSHLDVLQNNGSSEICQECGSKPDELRTCDGAFPSNLGFSWPETGQAHGKQLSCKRGFICDACDTTPGDDCWYCRDCRSATATHEDVLGYDIDEPSCLRTKGSDATYGFSLSAAGRMRGHISKTCAIWNKG